MEDENAIETFQAITGADSATAEHVLEAHGWDLNRGVNFFVESAGMPASRPVEEEGAPHLASLERASSVVDVLDEEDAAADASEYVPVVPERPASSTSRLADLEADDDLQAALAASLRTGDGASEGPASMYSRSTHDAHEDSFLTPQDGSPHPPATGADRGTRFGLPPGFLDEGEEGPRIRRNRPRGARAPDLDMSHLAAMGMAAGLPQQFASAFHGSGPPSPGSAAPAEANGNGHLELPAGINMEEARMLEAAMLGVPYEGRIPDFRNPPFSEPVSPSVLRQRALREEQDQAYQESLLADRRKADAAEAAKHEQEEEQRRRLKAEEDAVHAQRYYERAISEKLESLPREPASDDPEAVSVRIRLPNGNQFSRRFLRSSQCRDLFNYVDVSAAPDVKPGTYSLVTQFPRRVFEAGQTGSLADVGLTQKQEALFLEPA